MDAAPDSRGCLCFLGKYITMDKKFQQPDIGNGITKISEEQK